MVNEIFSHINLIFSIDYFEIFHWLSLIKIFFQSQRKSLKKVNTLSNKMFLLNSLNLLNDARSKKNS